jgi:VanZ family protein
VTALATWLPPVAWTGVVLAMSTASFGAETTGGVLHTVLAWLLPGLAPSAVDALHALVRKAAHVTEYAVLAALWFRAFARGGVARAPGAAWLALIVSLLIAGVDEWHQSLLPERTGSMRDVLLDSAGVMLAVLPAGLGWRRALDRVTGLLLWVGAVGGLATFVVSMAAGVGAGALWVTVPLAAVALLYHRRRAPSR